MAWVWPTTHHPTPHNCMWSCPYLTRLTPPAQLYHDVHHGTLCTVDLDHHPVVTSLPRSPSSCTGWTHVLPSPCLARAALRWELIAAALYWGPHVSKQLRAVQLVWVVDLQASLHQGTKGMPPPAAPPCFSQGQR